MCGIAGMVTTDGASGDDRQLAGAMLSSLAHRGPDDEWCLADDRAVIGARRLSIIDLDTGRQPVANEDDTVWATQNGEIYNYVELRAELERSGHVFRTQGDTETIAHLYEEHGDGFVDHLRGMFAIALWDRPRRRLVLARDRLGKKPLYWRLAGGRLSYGSELKALLADPSVVRRVDRTALAQFLEYQYIPSPRTIIDGIHKLPPATLLTWEGGEVTTRTYWEPQYEPKDVRKPADETRGVPGTDARGGPAATPERRAGWCCSWRAGWTRASSPPSWPRRRRSRPHVLDRHSRSRSIDELRYARRVARGARRH